MLLTSIIVNKITLWDNSGEWRRGPLGSILIGYVCKKFKKNIYLGLIIPAILPLLFTAQSVAKLISYIDDWILYACFYIIIALITYRLTSQKN
jgi:hypothetical protein